MTAAARGDPAVWIAEAVVPERAVTAAEEALEPFAAAVSSFESEGASAWTVAAYCEARPDADGLSRALAAALVPLGVAVPQVRVVQLPPTDWLAENRRSLSPVRVGRFFVHGSHVEPPSRSGTVPIRIDAGAAFGTGSHESTRGCLLALDRLDRRRPPRRVLDLGCGSGILALAAARLWRCPVLAVDIDPTAVQVSAANAAANRLDRWIETRVADGPAHPAVVDAGPFELIVANILARPLCRMAPAVAAVLAPGGPVVLSGLLTADEASVLGAYRAQRLYLERRLRLGEWSTLLVRGVARGPGDG